MKECPNCKTKLEDDELFCHECGTKQIDVVIQNEEPTTPKEKKCIYCGEAIEEDSVFCPYCGISQILKEDEKSETEKKPNSEEKLKYKEEDPMSEEKENPKETPFQVHTEEQQTTYEWDDDDDEKSKKWILWVIILAVGGAWYYFSQYDSSSDNEQVMAETVDSFTLYTISIKKTDKTNENEVVDSTSARGFIENFYKSEYLDEGFIESNVTANVLNKLKHDYNYECEEGNCLATWVFDAYPTGEDLQLEEGPIISDTSVDGKFKVDFKYSDNNGERKRYYTNTVFLTVIKIDGIFQISDYKVVYQNKTSTGTEEYDSSSNDEI